MIKVLCKYPSLCVYSYLETGNFLTPATPAVAAVKAVASRMGLAPSHVVPTGHKQVATTVDDYVPQINISLTRTFMSTS